MRGDDLILKDGGPEGLGAPIPQVSSLPHPAFHPSPRSLALSKLPVNPDSTQFLFSSPGNAPTHPSLRSYPSLSFSLNSFQP